MTDRDDLIARLERGLAVLADPSTPPEVVEAAAALRDVAGRATVVLLGALADAGTLDAVLGDPDVVDLLDLCGLRPSELPDDATPPADDGPREVAVSIGPHPSRRCELCQGTMEPDRHGHVADIVDRRLLCVCGACRLVLPDGGGGRFRAVPDGDPTLVVDTTDAPAWWVALDIPVGVAFLLRAGDAQEMTASYPGPAGVIESALPLSGLPDALLPDPDVEALLVSAAPTRFRAWRAPVTTAYELAGTMRSSDGVFGDADSVSNRFFSRLPT